MLKRLRLGFNVAIVIHKYRFSRVFFSIPLGRGRASTHGSPRKTEEKTLLDGGIGYIEGEGKCGREFKFKQLSNAK